MVSRSLHPEGTECNLAARFIRAIEEAEKLDQRMHEWPVGGMLPVALQGWGETPPTMAVAKGFREVDHRGILAHGRHRSLEEFVTLRTRGSVGSRVRLQLGQGRQLGPPTRLSWTQHGDPMTRSTTALLSFVIGCFGPASTAVAAERPNIVVVLVDDMGFSDIGCYGSEIPTPNLDRLAARGVAVHAVLQHGAVQPHARVAADGALSAPGRHGLARRQGRAEVARAFTASCCRAA